MISHESIAQQLERIARRENIELPEHLKTDELPDSWRLLIRQTLELVRQHLMSPAFARTILDAPEQKLLAAMLISFQQETRAMDSRLSDLVKNRPESAGAVAEIRKIRFIDEQVGAALDLEKKASR